MKAQIVQRPAFCVVGMLYHGRNQHNEIPHLWEQFWPRHAELQNVIEPEVSYGVCDHMDERTGEFDYMACMQVAQDAPAPTGMVKWEVPSLTYAVFPSTLPTIGPVYEAIYKEWMPRSGYHRAEGPDLELYTAEFDPSAPDSTLYLYIPVEKD